MECHYVTEIVQIYTNLTNILIEKERAHYHNEPVPKTINKNHR